MRLMILIFIFTTNVHSQVLLKIGDNAPDFKLPFATKDTIDFNGIELKKIIGGRNIIIAFYPADWSGGCTKEVCTFRDNFEKLNELNAEIIAISGDYVFSHKEWAKYHNLPYKLLSDHDHSIAKKYFSYNEKNGFNKRTVFIVDKSGKIAYLDYDYVINDKNDFEALKNNLEKIK